MFEKLREKLKGYKTVLIAVLYGVTGVALELHDNIIVWITGSGVDWKTLIPPNYLPYVLIGSAVLFGFLRYITTGPVGAKGDAAPKSDVKAGD